MAPRLSREELARRASARAFRGGLALFVPAPIDALLATTDLNEWAIEAAAAELSGAEPPEDEREARRRLERAYRREASPRLRALERAASARGVPFVWDDDTVTVGLAARSRTYPLDDLPRARDVRWKGLGGIPVALVTGTNGKTTTTRLVARMAKLAGLLPGSTSSDGVAIDERVVEAGDWTGAEAARMVLRRPEVRLAILETARGGILRRGLALDGCDAAIITNVSDDHLGEFGVTDLATMAQVKAVVGHAVRPGGKLVLSAEDPELARLAPSFAAELVLFALDPSAVRAHLASGGTAFVLSDGALARVGPEGRDALATLDETALTFRGAARHNVANCLGAAALGWSLGLPREAIVQALRTFGASSADNPGRGQLVQLEGACARCSTSATTRRASASLYALARTCWRPGAHPRRARPGRRPLRRGSRRARRGHREGRRGARGPLGERAPPARARAGRDPRRLAARADRARPRRGRHRRGRGRARRHRRRPHRRHSGRPPARRSAHHARRARAALRGRRDPVISGGAAAAPTRARRASARARARSARRGSRSRRAS
ncbi:MAG: Mur ligase family protein [Sandaracinaceae bacterium]|nr:Mur ligase family protein [Sandaracinaceae bacterium]